MIKLPSELGHEIYRTRIGSDVHGCSIKDQDDSDEMGIFIEREEYIIGLKGVDGKKLEHWAYRTQPEGARSGPGDLDLIIYTLRKWTSLALAGNPTVLMPLFASGSNVLISGLVGNYIRSTPEMFISCQVASRFLGYMHAQRQKLMGLTSSKHTNRPELIEKYGFDTKFAYHMIRLGIQGDELLRTGRITLPIAQPWRDWLKDLRVGKHTLDEAIEVATEYEEKLRSPKWRAHWPEHPDFNLANNWLVETYQDEWLKQQ